MHTASTNRFKRYLHLIALPKDEIFRKTDLYRYHLLKKKRIHNQICIFFPALSLCLILILHVAASNYIKMISYPFQIKRCIVKKPNSELLFRLICLKRLESFVVIRM